MGDCEDVLHDLYTFLDDETTPENRDRIRQHLEACQDCLEAFDFELELRHVIAAKCRDEVPPEVMQRLRIKLHLEFGEAPEVSS